MCGLFFCLMRLCGLFVIYCVAWSAFVCADACACVCDAACLCASCAVKLMCVVLLCL